MDKLIANGEPLNATVLSGNLSNMIEILEKKGFVKNEIKADSVDVRWTPIENSSAPAPASNSSAQKVR